MTVIVCQASSSRSFCDKTIYTKDNRYGKIPPFDALISVQLFYSIFSLGHGHDHKAVNHHRVIEVIVGESRRIPLAQNAAPLTQRKGYAVLLRPWRERAGARSMSALYSDYLLVKTQWSSYFPAWAPDQDHQAVP